MTKTEEITAAILRLRPSASFVVRGETVEWLDVEQTEPTAAEIEADISAHAYIAERIAAYPAIIDQLDQMFHDFDAWRSTIKSVKDQFPKPPEGGV